MRNEKRIRRREIENIAKWKENRINGKIIEKLITENQRSITSSELGAVTMIFFCLKSSCAIGINDCSKTMEVKCVFPFLFLFLFVVCRCFRRWQCLWGCEFELLSFLNKLHYYNTSEHVYFSHLQSHNTWAHKTGLIIFHSTPHHTTPLSDGARISDSESIFLRFVLFFLLCFVLSFIRRWFSAFGSPSIESLFREI